MKPKKNIAIVLALLAVAAVAFIWLKEAPPKSAGPETSRPETARPKISGPVDLASLAPMAIDEEMITYHLDRMSIDIPESFGPPKFSFTFGLNDEPRWTVITLSEFSKDDPNNANRMDDLTARIAAGENVQVGKPLGIEEFSGNPARITSWYNGDQDCAVYIPSWVTDYGDWPKQQHPPGYTEARSISAVINVTLYVEYSGGLCRYTLEHLLERDIPFLEQEAAITALENKLLELVKAIDYQWMGKNQAPAEPGRSATALGSVKWPADAPGPDMTAKLSFAPDYEDTENFVFEIISAEPKRGNAPPQINGDSAIAAESGPDSPLTAHKSEAAEAAANRTIGGRPGLESKLAEPHNEEMLKARFKFSEFGRDGQANQRLQEIKMNVLVDVYTEENLPYLLGLWETMLNSVKTSE